MTRARHGQASPSAGPPVPTYSIRPRRARGSHGPPTSTGGHAVGILVVALGIRGHRPHERMQAFPERHESGRGEGEPLTRGAAERDIAPHDDGFRGRGSTAPPPAAGRSCASGRAPLPFVTTARNRARLARSAGRGRQDRRAARRAPGDPVAAARPGRLHRRVRVLVDRSVGLLRTGRSSAGAGRQPRRSSRRPSPPLAMRSTSGRVGSRTAISRGSRRRRPTSFSSSGHEPQRACCSCRSVSCSASSRGPHARRRSSRPRPPSPSPSSQPRPSSRGSSAPVRAPTSWTT